MNALEDARYCADAEEAYAAAYPDRPNPWRGAGERQSQLEREHEESLRRQRGALLDQALSDYVQLKAEIEAATALHHQLEEAFNALTGSALIARWKEAPNLANRLGFGHHFVVFSKWFVSNRTPYNRSEIEFPGETWPPELIFGEEERDEVRRWMQAAVDRDRAADAIVALRDHRLPELLNKFPALAFADVAAIDRLAVEVD